MDSKKFGQNLITIGIIGVTGSVIWWFIFYSKVNQAFGGNASRMFDEQTLKCLIWNSGPCGFVTGIASAAGELAYQPMFLWISAVVVVVGLVMKNSSSSPTP
jgi:hypothetical protein